MSTVPKPDREAFRRLDAETWRMVYDRLLQRILRHAWHRTHAGTQDIEDMVAEIFAEGVRKIGTYNPARGGPDDWLMGIARRHISTWLRRKYRELRLFTLRDEDAWQEPELPESGQIIRQAMDRLPEPEGPILRMRYMENRSAPEIARRCGISESLVYLRLKEGRIKLRRILDGFEGETWRSES